MLGERAYGLSDFSARELIERPRSGGNRGPANPPEIPRLSACTGDEIESDVSSKAAPSSPVAATSQPGRPLSRLFRLFGNSAQEVSEPRS